MTALARVLAAFLAGGFIASGAIAATVEGLPLPVPSEGKAGFTRLAPEQTGVAFTNRLSDDAAAANQIRLNGSGVALGDIDGDGRVDIFLCGLDGPNALFRNLGGLRFEDVTGTSPIALPGSYCTGAVLADVDGDGDADLLVNAIGEGTRLFLNDAKGGFTERPDAGLERRGGPTTATLADVDGDGDLDLYVANYRTTTIRTTGFALLNVGGRRMVPPELKDDLEITPEGKVLEHGEPDCFYLNDGTGRFTREPWDRGRFLDEDGEPLRRAPRDWGLTATFRDINQDGFPDLYVANDFHSPDRILLNDGAGNFYVAPKLALRHTSTFSMSVDFGDLDRDGWDDFFLSDMLDPRRERRMAQFSAMEPNPGRIGVYDDRPQYDRNTLFWNRGDGTFAEIAHFAGLEAAGWSWSAALLDVDLDGFEDLLMTTGHMFDTQDLDAAARIERMGPFRRDQIPRKLLQFPRLQMPKAAFRNLGGLRFSDSAAAWGFDDVGVAHGLALADFDGDGDLDVVLNNLNAAAGIYRNNAAAPRVAVRLRGVKGNTAGIGARVSLATSGMNQAQEICAGGRYLSSDAPMRTFAWPRDAREARFVVAWRSGKVTTVAGVRSNRLYEVVEPPGPPPEEPNIAARQPPPSMAPGLFVDVSNSLSHRHVDEAFDDFQRQPLLPNKLSQPGPGVAWQDIDGDGVDDLVIGAGRGGRLAVFRSDGKGGFSPVTFPGADVPLARDVTGILGDPSGGNAVWIGLSNYEDGATNGVAVRRIEFPSGRMTDVLPDHSSAVGALAATDFDGDGDVDVFVGGRNVPGRYPEAAGAVLLRNDNGRHAVDAAYASLLGSVGLVTSAVWADLNADGFPELAIACEWGSIRVFKNERGRLSAWDAPVRAGEGSDFPTGPLSAATGWWTTLASADFDGDGRPDLLAGNWGLNTKYRASREHPVRIYFGDFDESGSLDVFETYFDRRLGREVPERDLMALRQAVPGVMAKFPTHAAYSAAGIDAVLGDALPRAQRVEAATLSSVVLLNRGDRWEARSLPDAAQWTPVPGAVCADFDGDGDSDVFLAQNFFAVQPTTSRSDAGRGLLLRNDGRGEFAAVRSEDSGIFVHGEQRGCAVADFDGDGRVDLVVAQNGAETKLFRNSTARPGLRVRVQGPAGNPRGIGVAMRAKGSRGAEALHEIQSGSGCFSQNSATLVLGGVESGFEIEARWPGGNVTTTAVPAGAREVIVRLQ